jgi:hypothetical protein
MVIVIFLAAALFSSGKENGWKIMAEANKPHMIVKIVPCTTLRARDCFAFRIEW